MTSGDSAEPTPALLRFAAALDDALDRLGDPDPMFLSASQKREALVRLAREEERLTALRLRIQAAADDVAADVGAKNAGVVLANELRRDRRKVAAEQELATDLERWSSTGTAYRDGRVNAEQAAVIVTVLDKLPARIGPELFAKAEDHLIDLAGQYGPVQLRALGLHIWEVIAPQEAEEELARQLQAEEAAAHAATRLNLKPMGDGSTRISGRLPTAVGQRLAGLLEAYTSPRRDHLHGGVRDAATGQRLRADRLRGQAFCTLLEHTDPTGLPQHGQSATTLVVTMGLDQLLAETGAGELLDRTGLSAGEVRRLACTAQIIPMVLGTDSDVLDQGRAARLFTRPQRLAMAVRDRHCRATGCTIPAAWCEAHHLAPWSRGGKTNLTDGALLCSFHHHRIHDHTYEHERRGDGTITFHRRT